MLRRGKTYPLLQVQSWIRPQEVPQGGLPDVCHYGILYYISRQIRAPLLTAFEVFLPRSVDFDQRFSQLWYQSLSSRARSIDLCKSCRCSQQNQRL